MDRRDPEDHDIFAPPPPAPLDAVAMQRLLDAEALLGDALRIINAAPGSTHNYAVAARIDAWLKGDR